MADLIRPQLQEIEEWDREQNINFRLPRPSDKSFLLSAERLSSLARYSSGEQLSNICETAATAHAQTCQNMSGYDLSNIYEETEIKHVSRPPEARLKVIATATAHAQHAKTCQDTTCQTYTRKQKSNMSVDLLKQGQKFLRHNGACIAVRH